LENLLDHETSFRTGEGLPEKIESKAVAVCEDSEIKRTCLDLTSMKSAPSCKLCFHINKDLSEMAYLCIYMKHVDAFTGFDIQLEAEDGRPCTFQLDNKSTISKVQISDNECSCSMPLILKRGWNHLNLDLQNLTQSAFGVRSKTLRTLSFRPRCRLFRVFLQEKPYSHAALPRVLMLTSV
jgi:hypothetical protein